MPQQTARSFRANPGDRLEHADLSGHPPFGDRFSRRERSTLDRADELLAGEPKEAGRLCVVHRPQYRQIEDEAQARQRPEKRFPGKAGRAPIGRRSFEDEARSPSSAGEAARLPEQPTVRDGTGEIPGGFSFEKNSLREQVVPGGKGGVPERHPRFPQRVRHPRSPLAVIDDQGKSLHGRTNVHYKLIGGNSFSVGEALPALMDQLRSACAAPDTPSTKIDPGNNDQWFGQ